jgi:hypothetical protein
MVNPVAVTIPVVGLGVADVDYNSEPDVADIPSTDLGCGLYVQSHGHCLMGLWVGLMWTGCGLMAEPEWLDIECSDVDYRLLWTGDLEWNPEQISRSAKWHVFGKG